MKSTFKLIILFTLSMSVAMAQGIEFFEGSWDEVLSEAKKERRLIFVDAYTTWCGPCKMMARNTFTDAEVGEYHNKNFVNYKFDMEKGEGPQFAAKYGVRAYPTIFWLLHKGEVVHKAVGYRAAAQLLMKSKEANSSENNAANLELGYNKGELEGKDLLDHALRLKAEDKPYTEAAAEFSHSSRPRISLGAGLECH
ncbi:MAG: thioredoxin domain-containing protein [Bacteroidia bacterium]